MKKRREKCRQSDAPFEILFTKKKTRNFGCAGIKAKHRREEENSSSHPSINGVKSVNEIKSFVRRRLFP